jgi:hypothetical protein
MAQDNDPVGNGFVASLARPGGNITGLATLAPELSGKQLELLKEIIPKLSRVAVLGSSTQPGNVQTLREIELAADALKVKIQYLDVLGPKILTLRSKPPESAEATLVLVALLILSTEVITFSKEPASNDIYSQSMRNLVALWPTPCWTCIGVATYVDKI